MIQTYNKFMTCFHEFCNYEYFCTKFYFLSIYCTAKFLFFCNINRRIRILFFNSLIWIKILCYKIREKMSWELLHKLKSFDMMGNHLDLNLVSRDLISDWPIVINCCSCPLVNFGSSSKWSKSCPTISFSTVSLTLIWSLSS